MRDTEEIRCELSTLDEVSRDTNVPTRKIWKIKLNIKVFNEIPSVKEILEQKQQVKVQKKKTI